MDKKIDKNTRFYIDIDVLTKQVLGWGYEQRDILALQKLIKPSTKRIFITKGQFNKLTES